MFGLFLSVGRYPLSSFLGCRSRTHRSLCPPSLLPLSPGPCSPLSLPLCPTSFLLGHRAWGDIEGPEAGGAVSCTWLFQGCPCA